jgi:hypothetical protein
MALMKGGNLPNFSPNELPPESIREKFTHSRARFLPTDVTGVTTEEPEDEGDSGRGLA